MPFVEFLGSHHNRASFDCGKEPLNRFIREIARQSVDRNLGVTQVITPEVGSPEIIGYYTLVTRTVEPHSLPEKKLPRGQMGVVLLGRLAVDLRYQGQGLGKRILLRAMADTAMAAKKVGIFALVLDVIDDDARNWYLSLDFGFKPLNDDQNRLYTPVSFIDQLGLEETTPEL